MVFARFVRQLLTDTLDPFLDPRAWTSAFVPRVRTVDRGATVFRPGDPGDHLYLVARGRVASPPA